LILPRFEGRVITIDVGISQAYEGMRAFLLIEDGKYYVVHRGVKLELPVNGSAGELNQYLGAAAQLEPPNSRVRAFVQNSAPTPSR
jgi:hypothetical protein